MQVAHVSEMTNVFNFHVNLNILSNWPDTHTFLKDFKLLKIVSNFTVINFGNFLVSNPIDEVNPDLSLMRQKIHVEIFLFIH